MATTMDELLTDEVPLPKAEDYKIGEPEEAIEAMQLHQDNVALVENIDSQNLGQEQPNMQQDNIVLEQQHVLSPKIHHPSTSSSEAPKTELEKEMELFEAAEAEEKSRILSSTKAFVSDKEISSQNEKKRSLNDPQESRKKQRGRKPSKLPSNNKVEEDDVCFVCYDGGDLMLCDLRTCSKAYHLPCIGRDEKFFQKKGNWSCGWHFCFTCNKKGSFRCYTCPKAYCAPCRKKSPFLPLKKGKGLCDHCLRLVRLIERGDSQSEVDFSDRETYECLFKDYWEDLKVKASIKLPEFDNDGKAIPGSLAESDEGSDNDASEGSDSEGPDNSGVAEVDDDDDGGKRERKTRLVDDFKCAINQEQQVESDINFDIEEDEQDEVEEDNERDFYKPEFDGWASKELLSFLKRVNEDPRKPLTRLTVKKLLQQYIKDNNLQHPRKKSIIRCDEQLRALSGKKTIHHQSLVKLLQLHLAPRGAGPPKKGYPVDVKDIEVDDDKGKLKSKSKKKDEYAAINPANVNLVYLRRALLEDLLDDPQFHQKVVGTYVRIRVPGMVSKSEMCYRLVQVVGTRTQDEEYKAGKKTTKLVLQIMNLGKNEDVTVDLVSNQDFTPEECKRLRQSIRCGIIPAPTVADFEQKNLAIREAKLNDWFETETARLTALRDRANEKGRKKDLRECVEKLQKLSKPGYRARELAKVPAFEVDPHMDPEYESNDESEPPKPAAPVEHKARGNNTWEKKPPPPPPIYTKQDSFKDEMDWRDNSKNVFMDQRMTPLPPPPPGRPPMMHPAPLSAPPPLEDVHQKAWFYLDPSGMEQGPFSIDQLRTWNRTGLFPPNLRIWKERQSRESAVLLLEVLSALAPPPPPPSPMMPPGPPPQHNNYGLASPAADLTRGWDRNDWGPRPNGNMARSPSMPEQVRGYDSWQQPPPQHQPSPSPRPFSEGGGFQEHNGWRSAPPQQQQGWSSGSGGWNENRGMKPGGGYGGGGYNEGRKKGTPCKFYQKGYCRNGDACPFQHA